MVVVSGLPLLALLSHAASRGQAGSWRSWGRDSWDLPALGAMLLVALGVQFADSHGVTTDGVIYFTQLRSALFDGDLDVAAEFSALGQPPRPSHVVPIGPTFVWLPLYVCVMAVDALGRFAGIVDSPAATAGLTLPYIRAALMSSFALGAIGLGALHLRLRDEFAPGVAFAASALLFAATPLVWYMVYEPAMTHAVSFGFVAMFVVAAERWTRVDVRRAHAVTLGVLLGCAVMTRPQEAIFALFPAILLLTARATVRERWRAATRLAGWGLIGIAPFLTLQALHSMILFGREDFALGGRGGYLDFVDSRWADTLWSSWHGFFSWTPVAYLAFVAMFVYLRRNRGWALAAIALVLLMAWINGSTSDWSGGWSFGGRRFISVLAVLAPGIALIVHGLTNRPVAALSVIAAAAIAWNLLLVVQSRRGHLSRGEPVSFAHIIRQQAALATAPPFVYPFAFPANALFALRTGLPMAQYDLLGAEPLRPGIDLQLNADAARFMTTGWGSRVKDPFGELYWIDGAGAELLLPLHPPADREITVAWSARTRRLDPPEPATFALVINGRETFRFTPDTEQASFYSFTVPPGAAIWVRGFNRVAFERRAGSAPVGIYKVAVK
jgi:hypothetical protein